MLPKKPAEFDIDDASAATALDQSLLLSLVGYNCRRAYITIMPLFEKRMAKFELRPVDFTVLSLLKANPNINQKRLSQEINVSPPRPRTWPDEAVLPVCLTVVGPRFC